MTREHFRHFSPHPDDNEVGAAGTLFELAQRGCQIVYITISDGSGSTGEVEPEAIAAIRRLPRRCSWASSGCILAWMRRRCI
ncbi:PIG-L family deacetylase [Paenibacillus sp. 2RAB27]|uniref:PIG-L family deacetylase n=1 Tax=Paenibacillus sp. 2RAB27 TaxID=3232991 RepID=UPI003F955DB6